MKRIVVGVFGVWSLGLGIAGCGEQNAPASGPDDEEVTGAICTGINCIGPLPDAMVEISAGVRHTCVRWRYGRVFCWGGADQLQAGSPQTQFPCLIRDGLGNVIATHACVSAPTQIAGSYKQVDAGAIHTCALNSDGTAACWGNADRGAIGIANGIFSGSPQPLTQVAGGIVFSSISAGVNSSCGTTPDGRIFCWGAMVTGSAWQQSKQGMGAGPGLGAGFPTWWDFG
ncbi:MAG TPA: hypothetical protein VN903_22700, partial [Polyangia bacterium]|nr:hypothetical protein [Polyangia bacterium]